MTSNISDLVKVDDKKLWQAMNDGYAHFEDFKRDVLAALTPSEPAVEVKEGYEVEAYHWDGSDPNDCPLSEALTIRTADEVRKEALDEALKAIARVDVCDPCGAGAIGDAERKVRALIDTPTQSPDECPLCGLNWGEHRRGYAAHKCPGKAEPSPEPVDWGDDEDFQPATFENDVIYIGTRAYVATDKTMGVADALEEAIDAMRDNASDRERSNAIEACNQALRALAAQGDG